MSVKTLLPILFEPARVVDEADQVAGSYRGDGRPGHDALASWLSYHSHGDAAALDAPAAPVQQRIKERIA